MSTNLKHWLLGIITLLLISCGGGPESYTDRPLDMKWDSNTEYRIDEEPAGYTITSYTSEFQMLPDRTAVLFACKSAIVSIAYDVADKRNKKIEHINEQRIRISLGRLLSNGVSGVTACSAQLRVKYIEL